MKILLCQDVDNLGYIGEVVEVKDGYARNYLLPYGIATVPTEENIKSLAEAKAAAAEHRRLAHEKLEKVAEAVNGAEAVIAAKANEQGHLFGSVTEKDIGTNLREQGYEVTDKMVHLSEHIKETGGHEVELRLAADITASIKVIVVSQDEAEKVEAAVEENTESE